MAESSTSTDSWAGVGVEVGTDGDTCSIVSDSSTDTTATSVLNDCGSCQDLEDSELLLPLPPAAHNGQRGGEVGVGVGVGMGMAESNVELFGVQLEVTLRLLEAERRKLSVLQRELGHQLTAGHGPHKKRQTEPLEKNIQRIQQQYEQLDIEYRAAALTAIKRSSLIKRSSRSQPAIGLKHLPKPRPTIFGTIAVDKLPADEKRKRQTVGPQMLSLSQMFDMAGSGYVGNSDHFPSHQALIFQNGNLLSGSLESLIQHLVPTADYYPDRTYIFAFLLSSRLFIHPHQLFAEVCQLCVYQQNLTNDAINRDALGKFGPHIVRLISEWTELFPYDFRDERMMKHMRDLTQRVITIYPELRKDISAVMHALVTRLSKLDTYEMTLSKLGSESLQKSQTQAIPTTDMMEVCPSPVVLAQQLTHIELERLSMIGPEEFIQAFCKERIESETFDDMKTTHNLESYVQWFNHLSYVVASEICSHLKKKNRVRMLEYFIDVAKECINLGNFNSLMAIIAGMNMNPVARLKKTWAKVNTAKFEILEHQMDPSNNFGSYRSSLKAAMWRAQCATNDRERVVIPFFSLFVKDLYFLNEGCTNRQPDGNINFEKCWLLAKQVSDLIAWQQVECPYEKNNKVMTYVQTLPVFSETTLSLASYECEPPENNFERERHKQLKSQAGL
ncbi:ras-GEF domain-containing family member 1B-like isoform X2 [Babylonia areolata]|uniref:ras-GEF domain-containing family member 1B-like isoform X2 n=1 Tax=Babylonia areolata TaxID=304850 RepID=UPI003FD0D7ED